MLDSLRNAGRTWVAKVLLGFLIVAVAAFGIPSIFLDLGANTVARVGSQDVRARDFERLYRTQLEQFRLQTGQVPTADQAMAFGLPGAALGRLATEAALDEMAQDLGLGVSDEQLALMVRQDPTFSGSLGAVDRTQFRQLLTQLGYTENDYLNLQRRAAMRQQIGLALFEDIPAPRAVLEIAHAYENDRRGVEYVTLSPLFFTVEEEPDEAELAQFFEENQARFRTQETRRVEILPLTPEALAAGIEVDDARIEAEYQRTLAQYSTEERRLVQQVPLPDAATAELFTAGNRPFADLLAESGLEGSVATLGVLGRGQIADPTLGNTAFELPENGYRVIPGVMGQRVVHVAEIEPAGQQPLAEVRDQIAAALRLAAARPLLLEVQDDVEEARAAFQPISEVADRHGLAVYRIDLTRDGAALAGIDTIPPEARANVVNQIFSSSQSAMITPAINIGAERTVFFTLEEVLPVRDRTLEEARDEVVEAWRALQTDLAIIEAAETMVAEMDSGTDLFTAAAQAGQVPQASQLFGRDGLGDGVVTPDVARAAFQGGEGYASYAQTANGEMIVFQVTTVQPASGDASAEFSGLLSGSFENDLYASFVTALQNDLGIRVNQQTLNRIVGLEQ